MSHGVRQVCELSAGRRLDPSKPHIRTGVFHIDASGDVTRLFEVAHALAGPLPVQVLNISKAERGYCLGGYTEPQGATKTGPVVMDKKANVAQAFLHIMQHGLAHLQANEPVLLEARDDPESLHQMRVATRRMRSCLKLFRPLIPRSISDPVAAEIKWVTGALGPAREWDVFISTTLAPLLREYPRQRALTDLECTAREYCATAYEHAITAIRSPRFTLLLLDSSLWLEQRPWRASDTTLDLFDQPASHFANQVLDKCHHEVIKQGWRFEQLDAGERHQLRIRCKALRYAAEFFTDLYGKRHPASYIRAVASLQDALGTLNDDHVAHQLLEQIQSDGTPPGAELVYSWTAANSQRHLSRFNTAWEAFGSEGIFWQ